MDDIKILIRVLYYYRCFSVLQLLCLTILFKWVNFLYVNTFLLQQSKLFENDVYVYTSLYLSNKLSCYVAP